MSLQVAPETRAALLWISSTALAVLVGLAEVYVGSSVVSRRHGGLAAVWVAITVLLNALIVPLSLSGLEAAPLWNVLGSRLLEVAWSAGLGILSTLCVCGCLWADVVRDGSGLAERYEAHLLGRISAVEAQRDALEAEASALRAQALRAITETDGLSITETDGRWQRREPVRAWPDSAGCIEGRRDLVVRRSALQ